MKNKYFRLWNGKDIEETDEEFQKKKLSFHVVRDEVFSNRNIKLELLEQIGTETFLTKCKFDGQEYNLLILNLKNSGLKNDTYRKRLQISKNINFKNSQPVFALSSYNAGDRHLYFFVEISEFLKSAKKGTSYSSFWIDYYQITKTYEKSYNTWIDNKNRLVTGVTDLKLNTLKDDEFIKILTMTNDNTISPENNEETNDNIPIIYEEKIHSRSGKLLPRNIALRDLALKRANYTCELCGETKTFITPNDGQYFEGHHLIMYNYKVQKRYKYCLDNIENIVCLCPTCHKKVHLSTADEKREAVLKLLTKHNKLLQLFEINDVEPIIQDYIQGVKDDE